MLKTLLSLCFYSDGMASAHSDRQRREREKKEEKERLKVLYWKCMKSPKCSKRISELKKKIEELEAELNNELCKMS